MTKKGSLDFLFLIYYIESRRRLPLLALPYYFFDEKMEFLGQSPFQRKEKRPCGMKSKVFII